jgi:hypothetical protein
VTEGRVVEGPRTTTRAEYASRAVEAVGDLQHRIHGHGGEAQARVVS